MWIKMKYQRSKTSKTSCFSVFFFMAARSLLVTLQSAKAGRIKEQERTCFRKSTTADRPQSTLSGSAIKRWAMELWVQRPVSRSWKLRLCCFYTLTRAVSRLQEWLHVDLGPRWTWWGHGSGLFRSSQIVRCLGWGSPAFGGGAELRGHRCCLKSRQGNHDLKDDSKIHFLACMHYFPNALTLYKGWCAGRPFTKQLSPRTTNLGSLGVAKSTRGGGESPCVRPSDLGTLCGFVVCNNAVGRSSVAIKSAGGRTPMLSRRGEFCGVKSERANFFKLPKLLRSIAPIVCRWLKGSYIIVYIIYMM